MTRTLRLASLGALGLGAAACTTIIGLGSWPTVADDSDGASPQPASPVADGATANASDVGASDTGPSDAGARDATTCGDCDGEAAAPSALRVTLLASKLSVVRGASVQVGVLADSDGALPGPLSIQVTGLPSGVSAESLTVDAGAPGTLTLDAKADATLSPAAKISVFATWDQAISPSASATLMVQDVPGTLDTTFGTNGVAIVPIYGAGTVGDLSGGLAVQADGRILYAGNGSCAGGSYGFVGRLMSDGGADTSFSPSDAGGGCANNALPTPGLRHLDPPSGYQSSSPGGVGELPSGGVAVPGTLTGTSGDVLFVTELTTDGTPLPSFGSSGTVLVSGGMNAASLLIESDGTLVIGGYLGLGAGGGPAILSLSPSGGPTSFDPPPIGDASIGFNTVDYWPGSGIGSLALLPNGDILAGLMGTVMGTSTPLAIAFSADGVLDPAFGSNSDGMANAPWSFLSGALGLALDSEGAFLVAVTNADTSPPLISTATIGLVRFLPTGLFDSSYGLHGLGGSPLSGADGGVGAAAWSLIAAMDGKAIVGATLTGPNPLGVIRYDSDGGVDPSFGPAGSGYVSLPLAVGSAGTSQHVSVALDSVGRILVAGMVQIPAWTYDASASAVPAVEIARLWP